MMHGEVSKGQTDRQAENDSEFVGLCNHCVCNWCHFLIKSVAI